MRRLIPLLVVILYAAAAPAQDAKKAERNWKGKCASCHGADGKGQTDQGKKLGLSDLTGAEAQKKSDQEIHDAIANGVKKGSAEMEGYKDKLDDESIKGLVAYIRTLKK